MFFLPFILRFKNIETVFLLSIYSQYKLIKHLNRWPTVCAQPTVWLWRDAVCKVLEKTSSTLEEGIKSQYISIFLDFSKAFDWIGHKILLDKLNFIIGDCGLSLNWIQSYLKTLHFGNLYYVFLTQATKKSDNKHKNSQLWEWNPCIITFYLPDNIELVHKQQITKIRIKLTCGPKKPNRLMCTYMNQFRIFIILCLSLRPHNFLAIKRVQKLILQ